LGFRSESNPEYRDSVDIAGINTGIQYKGYLAAKDDKPAGEESSFTIDNLSYYSIGFATIHGDITGTLTIKYKLSASQIEITDVVPSDSMNSDTKSLFIKLKGVTLDKDSY